LNGIKEYKQLVNSITFHPKTRRGGVLQNHNRPRSSILLSVTDMRTNVRMEKEQKTKTNLAAANLGSPFTIAAFNDCNGSLCSQFSGQQRGTSSA
jgi:hypothetical protein